MRKYIKHSRQFITRRGHMVSFLLTALMVTSWITVFQDVVNANIISTYM
ncbi:hypothetical protein K2X92_04015 [Candidatus Gracilibacteria bacterium]|nr:hypothetical protein [Candidatus Gracilibacteria bacterium]